MCRRRGEINGVKRSTENARGGRASLRLRTDVSLLASLYPERTKASRCPFSFSLSVYLLLPLFSSTCSALSPSIPLSSLSLFLFLICIRCLSPSLRCTPFFSNHLPNAYLPAARFCLTSLPLHPLFFSPFSNCSPVQPQMSPSISWHSNLPSHFLQPPSMIYRLSFTKCSVLFPFSALVVPLLRSSRLSFYSSFFIRLGLHSCPWISARLSKASFSAVFRPDEFGLLLPRSPYFSLFHFFPLLSHPLLARSI